MRRTHVQARIDPDVARAIDDLAEVRGLSRSAMLRELLRLVLLEVKSE